MTPAPVQAAGFPNARIGVAQRADVSSNGIVTHPSI